MTTSILPGLYEYTNHFKLQSRDSGNDFCRDSFLGYPERNDFVPSRTQKNPTRNDACLVSDLTITPSLGDAY